MDAWKFDESECSESKGDELECSESENSELALSTHVGE